jgi:hypothetical protein
MMFRIGILSFIFVFGCTAKDTDTDTETDTDTDTDTEEATLESLELVPSAESVSTREKVTFAVTAYYDDGSSSDVTSESSFTSSDTEILLVGTDGSGQPVNGGTVSVSAGYGGMEVSGSIVISLAAPEAGDIVMNEILADATVDGDPNGDGAVDSVEDEFIELANASDVAVDLSGAQIYEQDFEFLARHTFPDGTVLRAGEALVIFGGGDVDSLSAENVQYVTVQNEDPGQQYGLALTDSGDAVRLLSADGMSELASFAYGTESTSIPSVADQSLNLNPDIWGTVYAAHGSIAGTVGAYSPGTWVDGSAFVGPAARYAAEED